MKKAGYILAGIICLMLLGINLSQGVEDAKEIAGESIRIIANGGDTSADSLMRNIEYEYYNEAKKVLKEEYIIDPSTAVFPAFNSSFVMVDLKSDVTRVISYFDSENALGEKIRTEYTMVIRKNADGNKTYEVSF